MIIILCHNEYTYVAYYVSSQLIDLGEVGSHALIVACGITSHSYQVITWHYGNSESIYVGTYTQYTPCECMDQADMSKTKGNLEI